MIKCSKSHYWDLQDTWLNILRLTTSFAQLLCACVDILHHSILVCLMFRQASKCCELVANWPQTQYEKSILFRNIHNSLKTIWWILHQSGQTFIRKLSYNQAWIWVENVPIIVNDIEMVTVLGPIWRSKIGIFANWEQMLADELASVWQCVSIMSLMMRWWRSMSITALMAVSGVQTIKKISSSFSVLCCSTAQQFDWLDWLLRLMNLFCFLHRHIDCFNLQSCPKNENWIYWEMSINFTVKCHH